MDIAESILRVAAVYGAHRNFALSTVGRIAMGSGQFFKRLKAGRVTIRRAGAALQWFSDHWPAGLEWPADIPRPTPNPDRKEAA